MATGPSINKQNLIPLKDEICIACSMFFLHKDYKEINPMYHVFAPNPYPFGDEIPPKYIGGVNAIASEKTSIFLGYTHYKHSYWNYLEQNPEYRKSNMYHLNYSHRIPFDESTYDNTSVWDICKPLFGIMTVPYCAIQLAVYMGINHIYLLGCDHDYLTDMMGRARHAHFYRDEKGINDSCETISTEEAFLKYNAKWKHYRLMREYLEPRGCYIYNATEGGLLDVFPRVTLAEALAGSHEKKGG
ncbi:hypothetical protein ACFL0H_01305 [Thermodesulfobacteriota bacterium]